jgi:hypothetical protein
VECITVLEVQSSVHLEGRCVHMSRILGLADQISSYQIKAWQHYDPGLVNTMYRA